MHDQRVEARAALGGVDGGDGLSIGGIRAKAIDRLRSEGDKLALAQQVGGAGDAVRGCGQGLR